MIPKNELRIGNLVSKGHEWYVTDFITIKMAHNYEPIPLTPEILEKCGFKKNSRGRLEIKLYRGRLSGFWHEDYYATMYKSERFVDVKYIHQLQNLYFALTGEELKVNFHVEAAN